MKNEKGMKEGIVNELDVPSSLDISMVNQTLTVKGPKGDSKKELKQHNISINVENNKIIFKSKSNKKKDKKLMGSLIAHYKNMVRGSLESHTYTLKICSGHFPMNVSVSSNKFVVKNFLGEKVPRVLKLKDGASVKVEGDLKREISGNIKRLKDVKCYRGVRHSRSMPVRGQRTKTNSRTRRGNTRKTMGTGRRAVEKK